MDRLYMVVHINGDGSSTTWGAFDSLDKARAMLLKVQALLDPSERKHVVIDLYPLNPIEPDDAIGGFVE